MLYEKIQFEENEVVLTTVRKHWFIITMELLSVGIMAMVPFLLLPSIFFLPTLPNLFASVENGAVLMAFGGAAWLLIMGMMGFMVWTHYYLDLWVITDRRVIVIDQRGFFNRKVSSFRLERLQDIKVTVKGIIATLLNFGTIRAQTAGANESNFASSGMPDPRGIQATIQGAMDDRLKVIGGTGVLT
jgi:hypothetical protein